MRNAGPLGQERESIFMTLWAAARFSLAEGKGRGPHQASWYQGALGGSVSEVEPSEKNFTIF